MVESTALEMRRMGNRTVGSNPTLSAIVKPLISLDFLLLRDARGSAPLCRRRATAEVWSNSINTGKAPGDTVAIVADQRPMSAFDPKQTLALVRRRA